MSRHSFFVFLSSALLFVLLISLACPTAASADDGAPPPPATEEPVQPPVAEEVVPEIPSPATAAPVVVQESVATEEPVATEAPVEQANEMLPVAEEEGEGTGEEATVADFLEAAPEGTDVVVLDENGEALPLASVEAAEIAAVVDPMWCPDGQNPGNDMDDGIQNCSSTFATPQELIDAMDATNPGVGPRSFYEWNGTIYFTTNPGGSFVLTSGDVDLADYDALKRFSLTLQGGWNGATGAGYLLTGSQTEFTNNRIQIGTSANPWGGNITINNIKISPGTVSTEPGLAVYTDGRILLDYVDVLDNNSGSGAILDNDSLSLPVNRNVIVRHSNFNGNAGTGLQVASNGMIRLVDVGANENAVEGASLTTNSGEVNISGGSTFNGNLNNGLSVNAYGDITLLNVLARDNLGDGAVLDNTSGDGTVSITSGRFIHNDADGLAAYSNSDITLLNVLANRNALDGAFLDNRAGDGSINVGSSTLSGNGASGLRAYSGGEITLVNVTADGNAAWGAYLGNCYWVGEICTGRGINISSSTFGGSLATGNGNDGIYAFSYDDITLTNVTANGNDFAGAYLDNCLQDLDGCRGSGDIAVSSSVFGGELAIGNGWTGLEVSSAGSITLSQVTANGNAGDGAYLDNSSGSSNINISSSTFSGNDIDGLEAYSNGDITLDHVTANGNAEYGASLMNVFGSGSISVSSSTFGVDDGVSGNDVMGLLIFTSGSSTLTGVNANGNTGGGAVLINIFGGDILIVNSHFDGNAKEEGYGLSILSMGNVKLDTVSASNNINGIGGMIVGASGLVIKNSTFNENGIVGALLVTDGDATIVCSQFNGNLGVGVDGFDVYGIFTLNDVTISGNAGDYIGTPVFTSGGCGIVKTKSHKSSSSLSLHIVPVNGGEQIDLDCSAYSGTKLMLPNGDRVILPCPILDQGQLTARVQDQLPGPLDGQFDFISALEVGVLLDSQSVATVPAGMTVDFVIPEEYKGGSLAILRWDGTQWVEVPGGYETGDGRFAATSSFTGVFVLVTK